MCDLLWSDPLEDFGSERMQNIFRIIQSGGAHTSTVMQPAVIFYSKTTSYQLFELMKHKTLGTVCIGKVRLQGSHR